MTDITRRSQVAYSSSSPAPESGIVQDPSSARYQSFRSASHGALTESQYRRTTSASQAAGAMAGTAVNGMTMYIMAITTQPPSTARIGYPLYPACSIQVRCRYRYDDSHDDIGRLLVVATLLRMSSNGLTIESNLVNRRLTVSVSSIYENDDDDDDQLVGFASFPDITIQQAGDHYIRVTLVRMPNPGEQPVNIQAIFSDCVSAY